MIKITQDNATLPLSKNPNIPKVVPPDAERYTFNDSYISFARINEAMEYFTHFKKYNAYLVVVSLPVFTDLLADAAALRRFDGGMLEDMNFKLADGTQVYIIGTDSGVNLILGLSNLNIVPEKTTVTINDMVIEYNKDLSKVEINIDSCIELIDIKS